MSNRVRKALIGVALLGMVGVIVARYVSRPIPAELFAGLGVVVGLIAIAGIGLLVFIVPSRMTLSSMPELSGPCVLLWVNTDASLNELVERWKTESKQVGDRAGFYSVVSVERSGVGIWIGGKAPRAIAFVPVERIRTVDWELEPFRNVPEAPVVSIDLVEKGGKLRFLVVPSSPLRNISTAEADEVTRSIREVLDTKQHEGKST